MFKSWFETFKVNCKLQIASETTSLPAFLCLHIIQFYLNFIVCWQAKGCSISTSNHVIQGYGQNAWEYFRDSSKLKEGWEIKTIESSGESPKYRTLTSVIYSALQGFPFSLPTLKFEVLFFTSFLRHYKNMKRDWRDQLEVCLYIRKLKNKYLVYESKKIRIKFVKTKS